MSMFGTFPERELDAEAAAALLRDSERAARACSTLDGRPMPAMKRQYTPEYHEQQLWLKRFRAETAARLMAADTEWLRGDVHEAASHAVGLADILIQELGL